VSFKGCGAGSIPIRLVDLSDYLQNCGTASTLIAHMSCKSAIAYIEGRSREPPLVCLSGALAHGLQA
jgi:hypothetical protein